MDGLSDWVQRCRKRQNIECSVSCHDGISGYEECDEMDRCEGLRGGVRDCSHETGWTMLC
jgi:hypothetical protein